MGLVSSYCASRLHHHRLGQLDDPPPTQGSAAVLDMARAQESPDTMAFISDVRVC